MAMDQQELIGQIIQKYNSQGWHRTGEQIPIAIQHQGETCALKY